MKIQVYNRYYTAKLPVTGTVVKRGVSMEVADEEGVAALKSGKFFSVDSIPVQPIAPPVETPVGGSKRSNLKDALAKKAAAAAGQ